MRQSLREEKATVRKLGLRRRDALSIEARALASAAINDRLLTMLGDRRILSAAGYLPIRSEVDPQPAMAELAARGIPVAVPAIVDGDLVFRRLDGAEGMERQGFGTYAPGPDAEQLHPDLLIVPLAAFDRACGRCGYGKGFYDRAIARLAPGGRLLTIGVAFDAQRVDHVPMDAHDRALDMIVTESAVHHPSTAPGP
ncbi:hypothetical protein LA66_09535 [Aureimonas altamirensis]|uniref:5-formyltetrahydrofolate cyclo-ligase n=1 Tax=Aureimonas altamirensis TaxID=370622 RepID=A0A0B1Q5Z4_9HYPH|nr:hypothetical protein LA66_09535 [Aureimonas altamirensis]